MQLRSWLRKVKQTCLLEVFGFLFQTQWEQPGHQNSVRVNGVSSRPILQGLAIHAVWQDGNTTRQDQK